MGDEDLTQSGRFVWKRNLKYDLALLAEVNSRNPYAFNNQKPIWTDIACVLQQGNLKMKVTDRSCREGVAELLKNFRRDELVSIRTSGASEEELSELKVWLTDVAKLEEVKPSKELKSLYSRKDRNEAEAIRKKAIESVANRERALKGVDNWFHRKQILEELEENETIERNVAAEAAAKTAAKASGASEISLKRKLVEQDVSDDFEFGPSYDKPTSSKKDMHMIRYLQTKSEREIDLRKEELQLRKKEAETKAKEIDMLRDAKEKENEIARLRTEAEIEDRKKITDLLIKLNMEKRQ